MQDPFPSLEHSIEPQPPNTTALAHLDRLERWAQANLMKLNKAKGKVLHMGRGNLKHTYRLDGEQP